jgi:hypothetical protein
MPQANFFFFALVVVTLTSAYCLHPRHQTCSRGTSWCLVVECVNGRGQMGSGRGWFSEWTEAPTCAAPSSRLLCLGTWSTGDTRIQESEFAARAEGVSESTLSRLRTGLWPVQATGGDWRYLQVVCLVWALLCGHITRDTRIQESEFGVRSQVFKTFRQLLDFIGFRS